MSRSATNSHASVTRYADVAPAVPLSYKHRQIYTYRVPPTAHKAVRPLVAVTVPFGRRNVPGVIIRLHQESVSHPTQELSTVSDPSLTAGQVSLARWIARTMQGGLGYTLRLFLPPPIRKRKEYRRLPSSAKEKNALSNQAAAVIQALQSSPVAYIERDHTLRTRLLQEIVGSISAAGKQVLILVPEIWMASALARRLDDPAVTLLHAGLPATQLYSIWQGVHRGRLKVVIGTQKALFLPFTNLGLIVVEEEQYSAHKLWDQYPRLHNTYAAQQLAAIHHAPLLYTTSYPSLRLQHATATQRVKSFGTRSMRIKPTIFTSTPEDRRLNRLFPQQFVTTLRHWRKSHQRVLIVYNQRNAAKTSKQVSSGTVEQTLKKLFPRQPNVLRIDAGIAEKISATKLASALKVHTLILGTAALLTVLQESKLDRVVLLWPERSLSYPDFRTRERMKYLMARLQQLLPARRNLTIVTRQPHLVEEMMVQTAADELKERQRLYYPPFTDMVRLTVNATSQAKAEAKAVRLRQQLEKRLALGKAPGSIIRGPFQSLAGLRRHQAAVHILLLGDLKALPDLYENLALDTTDLAPEHIF